MTKLTRSLGLFALMLALPFEADAAGIEVVMNQAKNPQQAIMATAPMPSVMITAQRQPEPLLWGGYCWP